MRVLAGDIGATNARLALFEWRNGRPESIHEARFSTGDYSGLAEVVARFRSELDQSPRRVCLGVACPLEDGACRMPNLDWVLDERALREEIGIRETRLINDFDAVGHGLALLDPSDLAELQEGDPAADGTVALLGAGTGLGAGFVGRREGHATVYSSEAGHADFSPRTNEEWELREFLRGRHGRVSWERVLSGPGLVDIYRFLAESGFAPERETVRREMDATDPAAVVSSRGLAGDDPLCVRALEVFVSLYGSKAGDLVLTLDARGGVYLAGGIAPKILPKLREGEFRRAFRDKGRLKGILERVPVHVILNPDVGLLGAARVAARLGE